MGAIRKIRGISYLVKRLTKTSMQSKLVLGCVRRGVRHLQSPDRVWSGVHLVTSPIPGTLKIPPFGTSVSKRVPPLTGKDTLALRTQIRCQFIFVLTVLRCFALEPQLTVLIWVGGMVKIEKIF